MLSAAAPQAAPAPRALAVAVRALEVFLFVGLPVAFAGVFTYVLVKSPALFDFQTFWQSGRAVLHGHSPYPSTLPSQATTADFRPFVYPAPAAVLMVPFALLPWAAAQALWVALSVGAVGGTLRLLGVRDWRVYGIVFVWPAVWSGLGNGTATLLMAFACALLWRLRSRPYAAGALVALLVVFKLYLWPLSIWLLATHRVRAAVSSFVATAVAVLAGWAVIGFDGFTGYLQLLNRLTALVADESYSPYALARSLGAGVEGARLVALCAGGVLLLGIALVARRERGDEVAFMLAVTASLALTPIVWPNYFALLLVVVALASPRLDVGWVLPIFAWMVSSSWSGQNSARIAACLAVYGLTAAWAVWRASAGRASVVAPVAVQAAVK